MRATSGVNWSSPTSPVGADHVEYYMWLHPIPPVHPPSLKNPIDVPIPTARDGWERGASKAKRQQAIKDLKTIHDKVMRQIGRPNIAVGAPMPTFPNMWDKT